jgi:predicted alpha/beta-fold hydrolase
VVLCEFGVHPLIYLEIKLFPISSGLDFAPADHSAKLKDDTPIVVVQHGLTGGT